MRGGKLDRRIRLERPYVQQQEDTGEEVHTWLPVATVWAEKVEQRGAERFAARQFVGSAIRTFRFRWSETVKDVTVHWRIYFDGRHYDITDVRELGRRVGIEIDCNTRSEDPVVT